MAHYLGIVKAEYGYEAATDEELSIEEDDILYVLEDDDPEWWKVKVKTAFNEDASEAPSGLVPASYIVPLQAIANAVAMYAYSPSNEEELEITEDEPLELFIEEDEWALVGKTDGKGVGFVPLNYIERSAQTVEHPVEDVVHPEPEPVRESTPEPVLPVASSSSTPSKAAKNVKTWNVNEIDKKKKKKKKGTLGVGNGAVFFASESDKTPVQQYPISTLESHSTEKAKHLFLKFSPDIELHFTVNSKEALEEIIAKIEENQEDKAPTLSMPPPPTNLGDSTGKMTSAFLPPPVRSTTAITTGSSVVTKASNGSHTESSALVLYAFDGEAEDELSIAEGERLTVLDSSADDWWKVRKADGSEGVVPASYIEFDDASHSTLNVVSQAEEPEMEDEIDANEDETQRLQDEEDERERQEASRRAEDERKRVRALEAQRAADARRAASSRAPPPSPRPVPVPTSVTDPAPSTSSRSPDSHRNDKDKRPSKPSPSKTRIWKDRSGQFKVEAEFLGLAHGKIRLHKLNGVIIEVPLEKMSSEDIHILEKLTGHRFGKGGKKDRKDTKAIEEGPPTPARPAKTSTKTTSSTQAKKSSVDWFEFFLAAGCEIDDCTRYASNFDRDRMDESVLPDLEASTLRTLGLREGDIIRVQKHIKQKYGMSNASSDSAQDQIRKDEDLARQLQSQDSLFTGPGGGLKTTRRGRPNPSRSVSSQISVDAITSAGEHLSNRGVTPPILSRSPAITSSPPEITGRSSSAVHVAGGFDDDAWTVKASSKPPTPAIPPAPSPAPAILLSSPELPQTVSPAATSNASLLPRPTSANTPASSTAAEAYNLGVLAGLKLSNRPPSAPVTSAPSAASQPQMPLMTGARGPLAPTAGNEAVLSQQQPLMRPLIATSTAFNNFVPTRPNFSQSQMIGQPTGMVNMQPTGFMPTSMAPINTGFNSMPPMPTMTMSQAGFVPPAPLRPQPTGFAPGGITSLGPSPYTMPSQAPNFSMPPAAPAVNVTGSTPADKYQPANVFASMKTGQFGQNPHIQPQDANKYDALRPQPTGFNTFVQPQFPQVTGFQQPGMPYNGPYPMQSNAYGPQPYRQY